MITKEAKFQLIDNILKQPNNLIQLDDLCEIACVSRSSYYYWRKTADTRNNRELQDQMDFNLILEAFKYRGYDKGIRGIHMRLLHRSPPVKMNVKKIQRLMRKYGLLCPIRKAYPYRKKYLTYLLELRPSFDWNDNQFEKLAPWSSEVQVLCNNN